MAYTTKYLRLGSRNRPSAVLDCLLGLLERFTKILDEEASYEHAHRLYTPRWSCTFSDHKAFLVMHSFLCKLYVCFILAMENSGDVLLDRWGSNFQSGESINDPGLSKETSQSPGLWSLTELWSWMYHSSKRWTHLQSWQSLVESFCTLHSQGFYGRGNCASRTWEQWR